MNDGGHPGTDRKENSPDRRISDPSAMSGIEFLRALQAGELHEPPVADLIGVAICEVEEGSVVFEFSPSEQHYNFDGTVQGGITAAVIDAATGCAIQTALPAGTRLATLNLNVQCIKPVTADVGKMRCEARTIHVGKRVGTAEAKLVDGKGNVYAFGFSSCMIFR